MANSINRFEVIGRAVRLPDVRYTTDGKMVVSVSVATNESWTSKETGKKEEHTEFHRAVFYEPVAKIAADYIQQGARIRIEGKLRTRKWQTKEGEKRETTEYIVRDLMLLDKVEKKDESEPAAPDSRFPDDEKIPF